MKSLEIRQLTLDDENAFFAGLKAWEGEASDWHSFVWKEGMMHADHIRILENERRGIDLPDGRVPHTSLYGFLDEMIVGRCSVRHRLNDSLQKRGGHIGYAVAPRFRRRGFGTQLFEAGLGYLKSLGETAALLTCAKSNLPSIKMITKAGGILERERCDDETKETTLLYWIDLAKPPEN